MKIDLTPKKGTLLNVSSMHAKFNKGSKENNFVRHRKTENNC